MEWNNACLREMCRTSGRHLFVSPAEDTVGSAGEEPTTQQKLLVAASENKERLAHSVTIAEGMRAMLTWNLVVSADLANGTQGTVEKIFLDPREDTTSCTSDQKYHTSSIPSCSCAISSR
jgi:hypothetical protein